MILSELSRLCHVRTLILGLDGEMDAILLLAEFDEMFPEAENFEETRKQWQTEKRIMKLFRDGGINQFVSGCMEAFKAGFQPWEIERLIRRKARKGCASEYIDAGNLGNVLQHYWDNFKKHSVGQTKTDA